MALDFTVLEVDGNVLEYVPLGINDHRELMRRAMPQNDYPFIHRLSEYYEDVFYDAEELAALRSELERVDRTDFEAVVESILEITARADAEGRRLEVLAD